MTGVKATSCLWGGGAVQSKTETGQAQNKLEKMESQDCSRNWLGILGTQRSVLCFNACRNGSCVHRYRLWKDKPNRASQSVRPLAGTTQSHLTIRNHCVRYRHHIIQCHREPSSQIVERIMCGPDNCSRGSCLPPNRIPA